VATRQEAELYAQSIAANRGIVRKGKVKISPSYSAHFFDLKTEWVVEKLQLCFTRPGNVYFSDEFTPDKVEAKLSLRNEAGEIVMRTVVLLDFLMRGSK
jgi:hypothetical protein